MHTDKTMNNLKPSLIRAIRDLFVSFVVNSFSVFSSTSSVKKLSLFLVPRYVKENKR
jgi:hypothetical protein